MRTPIALAHPGRRRSRSRRTARSPWSARTTAAPASCRWSTWRPGRPRRRCRSSDAAGGRSSRSRRTGARRTWSPVRSDSSGPSCRPTSGAVYPFTIASRDGRCDARRGGLAIGIDTLAVSADSARLYGAARVHRPGVLRPAYVFDLRCRTRSQPRTWSTAATRATRISPVDDGARPEPGGLVHRSPAGATGRSTTLRRRRLQQRRRLDRRATLGLRRRRATADHERGDARATSTRNPGTYTVKLTTTNAGGCASRFVYTGQSAACSGSTTATTSRTVTIITPGATAATADGRADSRRPRATLSGHGGRHRRPDGLALRVRHHDALRADDAAVTRGTGAVQATVTEAQAEHDLPLPAGRRDRQAARRP